MATPADLKSAFPLPYIIPNHKSHNKHPLAATAYILDTRNDPYPFVSPCRNNDIANHRTAESSYKPLHTTQPSAPIRRSEPSSHRTACSRECNQGLGPAELDSGMRV
ncbi:hypothetical protein XPA_009916 [Xanthoria parietina]